MRASNSAININISHQYHIYCNVRLAIHSDYLNAVMWSTKMTAQFVIFDFADCRQLLCDSDS